MKTVVLSLCLFAAGIAAGISIGAVSAKPARPVWSYHNGNTLIAHTADYRRGYYIGVMDGYLEGHRLRAERNDDGRWLDACLTGGWTEKRAAAEMEKHLQAEVKGYANPAVAIVIDGMRTACAKR